MNRLYTAPQAEAAVRRSMELGFLVDIEFIFGYPGQTMDGWLSTMEAAVALEPDEIQLYRLKVKPYGLRTGTIARQFAAEPGRFVSDEETLRMKQAAHSLLRAAGYDERLIRVFSRDPKVYSHYAQSQCCTLKDIIAFGSSARSGFSDRASINAQDPRRYCELAEQGLLPIDRGAVRTPDDQLRWALILPLRSWLVYKKVYERQAGRPLDGLFRGKLARLRAHGLLEEDEKTLRLTPLGRFFAEEVCWQFYHPDYMPLPRAAFADGELNPYAEPEPGG
jgi:oxygen-independent coproporphyrinogen-3 oxidase